MADDFYRASQENWSRLKHRAAIIPNFVSVRSLEDAFGSHCLSRLHTHRLLLCALCKLLP